MGQLQQNRHDDDADEYAQEETQCHITDPQKAPPTLSKGSQKLK